MSTLLLQNPSPLAGELSAPARIYHNVVDHYENPRNVGTLDIKKMLELDWWGLQHVVVM